METKKILSRLFCPLFVLFMIFIIFQWDDLCNNIFWNGANTFYAENKAEDIKNSVNMVCVEELIFRVIPFFITSFAIVWVKKTKWLRYLCGTIGVIGIIGIQLWFGALHYNPLIDTSHLRPMICQGVAGIILSITYAGVLCFVLKKRLGKNYLTKKDEMKAILIANFIAFLASSLVHALANLLMVFTQSF